jgi:hypothetical protein
MQKSTKYFGVLFAVFIIINSIGRTYYYDFIRVSDVVVNENNIFYFSQDNINSFYFLHKLGDKSNNFTNNLPSYILKNIKSSFEKFSFVEIFYPCLYNYYSSLPEILQYSISVKVIIYPFHSFG